MIIIIIIIIINFGSYRGVSSIAHLRRRRSMRWELSKVRRLTFIAGDD